MKPASVYWSLTIQFKRSRIDLGKVIENLGLTMSLYYLKCCRG